MPDDPNTPPVDPQAGDTGNPQPQAGNNPPDPQAGDGEETISIEEAKKLRSEAKNLRSRLKELDTSHNELKAFKAQIDAEKLSTEEKQQLAQKQLEQQIADLQKEREIATRQTQELRVTNEVFKHGQRLNIVDLDAAVKLLDSSQIDYDDSGLPTNIDALLKTLVKERSWLVDRQRQTSGGATNPSREQISNSGEITPEYAKRVLENPKEFRALSLERQQQISRWIADNANKL